MFMWGMHSPPSPSCFVLIPIYQDGALEELEGYIHGTEKEPHSSGKRCLLDPTKPAERDEEYKKKHSISTEKESEKKNSEQLGSRNNESKNCE